MNRSSSSLQIQPREKLVRDGLAGLADCELISILLRTGSKQLKLSKLANRVLEVVDKQGENLALNDLKEINGVGLAKAATILAAVEFSRRRIRPYGVKISNPSDIYPLVRHLADRKQENFICVSLNGAHEVLAVRIITIGLVNVTLVHPREVFSDPIIDRASAIVVAHNHPSGSLEPSEQDKATTLKIKEAGEILGIKLLDHLIFTSNNYFSFADKGLL